MDSLNDMPNGIIFLDAHQRPYNIRMWGDTPWIFYWHADKRWVSLRPTNQSEIWTACLSKLSDEDANIYHELNDRK